MLSRNRTNPGIQQPVAAALNGATGQRILLISALLVSLAWTLVLDPMAHAVEQAEAFVEGLRERGHNDLLLDYLERMQDSSLVDESFKRRIDYHRGVTLIDEARATYDAHQRAELLDAAGDALSAFAEANPTSLDGIEAQGQLATVLVERAKFQMAQADKLPDGDAHQQQREQFWQTARQHLDEAVRLLEDTTAFYHQQLDALPDTIDPNTQGDEFQLQQSYRWRLTQAEVLAAQLRFEKAQTYSSDSADYRRLNEEAAQELGQLYERNSRSLIGLYAHLYEGRAFQALGQYPQALGCFDDIVSQPEGHPAFRRLISVAYRHQAECLLAQEKYDAAIANLTEWLDKAHRAEETAPEWLAVRFQLAEAYRRKADSLDDGSSQQRRMIRDARETYTDVTAVDGEFQKPARMALAALSRSDSRPKVEPKTFAEAYDAGKDALAEMNAAKLSIEAAEMNNPQAVDELKALAAEAKSAAREYFREATLLVDEDTELSQLNEVRFYLCWMYWEQGDYYRAAILGEFLARRYTDHSAAAAAAKIALASYERLYHESVEAGADAAATAFESRRMAEIAEFITRRWPGSRDADAAFAVLVNFALRNDQIQEATRLLDEVSPERRTELELRLGTALWSEYLTMAPIANSDQTSEDELDRLRASAIEYLQAGLAGARNRRSVTPALATAVLYLVQARLESDDYRGAQQLLEDRRVGPLTLVDSNHPAANRPGFATEVYKAAVRTFLSVEPPQTSKALEAIERLERAVERDGGNAKANLAAIYISLGRRFQQQIKDLNAAGRRREADRLGNTLIQLMDRIAADPSTSTWAESVWIAQTYFNLAQSLESDSADSAQAKEYFARARDIYEKIVQRVESDADFAPSDSAMAVVRKELGECQRNLGQYNKALDTFSAILRKQEARLDVQRAAAYTYQAWGEAEDARWLERAIYGGRKVRASGKNRVWGWLKLAQVTQRSARTDPALRDAFFEARLNAARCRYLIGMRTEGDLQRKNLAIAKQSIRSMAELYPSLGGGEWKSKFDQLLKQIQRAEGREPKGLQEFAAIVRPAG